MEGKRTVVLTIPVARIVPTAYREERWIRIGSSKEKLRKYPDREAALFRILNAQQNPTDDWEKLHSKFYISDINRPLFDDYLKKAKEVNRITISSDEPRDVLNSIEIAEGDDLLNAAAAIFVESGINELQMVKFATDERLTIIDSKRYTGSILSLVDKAVTYISDTMDWKAVFTGELRREEFPEVPMPAIREAVINAFAHRNIESRQAVDISIYKSYIDIYSPGLFPLELNPEDFIKRTIKPPRRNPLITKTLYYSRDMEAFATGFQRIDKAFMEDAAKMRPNENFRKFFPEVEVPEEKAYFSRSSCLKAGTYMVINKTVKDLGLEEKLQDVFGATHQHKRALALTSRKFLRLLFSLLDKEQLYSPEKSR